MFGHSFKDLTGHRFGRLIAKSPIKKVGSNRRAYSWLCVCDCGSEAIVDTGHLSSGHTKSCGCAQLDGVRKASGFSAKKRTLRDYKTKAKLRGFCWKLSDEEFDILTSYICYYCGTKASNRCAPSANGCFIYNGIDRINNLLGYTLENTVSCCKICNIAKRDMSQEAFLAWAERVVNHSRNQQCPSKTTSSPPSATQEPRVPQDY